jgi:tRNA threonylcarbamoyladenosine biosynthesis protein TsaE
VVITSHSEAQTEKIGMMVGALLQKGSFLALYGDLGGGKTCFTRGVVASAAPGSADLVASPTFAIMNEYPGQTPVYHFDFYRLASGDEIAELGFDDFFHGQGICIAEWSEHLGEMLPEDHLKITFEHAGTDNRKITIEARGEISRTLLSALDCKLTDEEFL